LKVANRLSVVDWQQRFDSLYLDDELVFNDEVEAIGTLQPHAFVHDGNGNLAAKSQTTQGQLMNERTLIDRLEEPGSELTMDLYQGADHGSRAIYKIKSFVAPSCLRVFVFHALSIAVSQQGLRKIDR
jgi:hypothetical protein